MTAKKKKKSMRNECDGDFMREGDGNCEEKVWEYRGKGGGGGQQREGRMDRGGRKGGGIMVWCSGGVGVEKQRGMEEIG